MKQPVLERYSSLQDGRVVIDVAAGEVDQLFEHFDRRAPYHKKDLASDLVDYLLECVREIGPIGFIIRFSFAAELQKSLEARVIRGVHEYFRYRSALERSRAHKTARVSLLMVMAGFLLLTLTIQLRGLLPPGSWLLLTLVYEGLTIIAWIVLWEAVAGFFVNWFAARRLMLLCQRLSQADVEFCREDHS